MLTEAVDNNRTAVVLAVIYRSDFVHLSEELPGVPRSIIVLRGGIRLYSFRRADANLRRKSHFCPQMPVAIANGKMVADVFFCTSICAPMPTRDSRM
jgi:hypothetical protein